jgi:E3 ubiquitin-protein ligase UHRF1
MGRDNQALLLSLGLGEPSTKSTKSAESLKKLNIAAKKKRLQDERAFKPEVEDEKEEEDTPRRKRPSLASPSGKGSDGSLLRRSSRSVRAIKRLADEVFAEAAEDDFDDDDEEGLKKRRKTVGQPQRLAKSLGKRTQDPYVSEVSLVGNKLMNRKQFGHIPGVEVGRTWASRMECSTDAIHA